MHAAGKPPGRCRNTFNKVDVFEAFAGIADRALQGRSVTVFAYGQTGSGKTHLMAGPLVADGKIAWPNLTSHERGLIPRTLESLFDRLSSARTASREAFAYQMNVSFLEIYKEQIFDLLVQEEERRPLDIRQSAGSGVVVQGLSKMQVVGFDDILHVLQMGMANRSWRETRANSTSSRSHAMFQVSLQIKKGLLQVISKLTFVDLAGSEKVRKPEKSTLAESVKINLSLSALGHCISAMLNKRRTHVPYRNSKLTRLLQESLQNPLSATVMCICLAPGRKNIIETLRSLQFANQAKKVRLRKAPPSVHGSSAMLKDRITFLENKVNQLTAELVGTRQRCGQWEAENNEGPPLAIAFMTARRSLQHIVDVCAQVGTENPAMEKAKRGLAELIFAVSEIQADPQVDSGATDDESPRTSRSQRGTTQATVAELGSCITGVQSVEDIEPAAGLEATQCEAIGLRNTILADSQNQDSNESRCDQRPDLYHAEHAVVDKTPTSVTDSTLAEVSSSDGSSMRSSLGTRRGWRGLGSRQDVETMSVGHTDSSPTDVPETSPGDNSGNIADCLLLEPTADARSTQGLQQQKSESPNKSVSHAVAAQCWAQFGDEFFA